MKKVETKTGKRLLDYLDIHYYFQPDTSANDDAAKALRLRMTRSLWVSTTSSTLNLNHYGTNEHISRTKATSMSLGLELIPKTINGILPPSSSSLACEL